MVDEDALAEAYEAALALEKSGDPDAPAAWRKVLALNPSDPGGAAVRLAALGAAAAPDKASPAYVATLFDQHAEVFDGILVDQLEYGVPMLVRERAQALGLAPLGRLLDLGCGTGLAAEALEDMAGEMTGVDLAEGMIEIADEKELYHRLFVGDAAGFLEQATETWDVIAATDVLPYLGDAKPLFESAALRIADGGVFVFSTETLAPERFAAGSGAGWLVTPHHRFAHDPGYIEATLDAAGFAVLERTDVVVRKEMGEPIPGHLFFARFGGAGRSV